MSAARGAAAAIVAVTLAMNAGTSWVLFGTEFLSRFGDMPEFYVVATLLAVTGFVAVSTSYVLVGLLLSGRRGAGRIAAVLLAGGPCSRRRHSDTPSVASSSTRIRPACSRMPCSSSVPLPSGRRSR